MQDTQTIKLPVSGKEVVIRNYTTRADDEVAESLLYDGVNTEQEQDKGAKLVFPIANIMASQKSYIARLVQSIDGDSTSIGGALSELRTEDYEEIEKKVEDIIAENSPKAREVKKTSNLATNKK